MDLSTLIAQHTITMSATRADSNPAMADEQWSRDARHWKCTLRHDGRQMTVSFSQGSAHTEPPTMDDVLDCLASDAAGYDNAQGFEDWANEYGYDTDSRKAERSYNLVGTQSGKLRRLLGDDLYETLLWDTERQ